MNNELKESKKNIKHSNSLALFLVGSLIMTSLWGCAAKKDNDSQDLKSTEISEEVVEEDNSGDDDNASQNDASKNDSSSDKDNKDGTVTNDASSYKTNHLTKDDISINETYEDDGDGSHAITADGEDADYTDAAVYKTGEANGDIFFVNNTACTINLEDVNIVNNDSDGVFLRAQAAGWGNSGSNGGKVTLTAVHQNINGDMIVDEVSALNLYLTEETAFVGAINSDGTAGEVYVELDETSTWTLTEDSYINSLTCVAGSINLNGHILYVNGEVYTDDSDSTGEAIEIVSESSSGETPDGEAPDGMPGDAPSRPDGNGSSGGPGGNGGTPPEKPKQ